MTTTQRTEPDRADLETPFTRTLPSGVDATLLRGLARRVVHPDGVRVSSECIRVRAPFTGETLGEIPHCTANDVDEAVRRARRAQGAWAATAPAKRAKVLLRFHDLLLARAEQGMDIIQLESGKARRHALEEILDTALVARHYAVHGPRYLRSRKHRAAFPVITTAIEHRHPVGVVGVIAPWNFPLILSVTDLLAALMAGNAVVLRPDVQSSFTALWSVALLDEAGLPRDLLCVVTGEGEELGPPLIDRVDFVMFTGSTRTGKIVARQAADRLIGCSLELGGKNPMLVLADADVERAVGGLLSGAFSGAGQVCVSIERCYVHASLYDRFAARLVERVKAMRLSAELDFGADMGSMTTARQVAAVEAQVADALAKGARLLAGGRRRPDLGPLFYEPTVLADVTPAMTCYAEETFGPVVALYRFETEGDAIERANDTRYGLNASVWSRSTRRALAVARRIQAGSVNVNEAFGATWSATSSPIGGMKESGIGRRHGVEGILKYTEAQTVAVQRGMPLGPPRFMRERAYARVVTGLLRTMRRLPGLR